MKKLLLLFSVLYGNIFLSAFAQEHMIEVARFTDWGKDYLTIVNGNYIRYDDGEFYSWRWFEEPCSLLPRFGFVITDINGVSTKGMEPWQFYEYLDSNITNTLSVLGEKDKICITRIDQSLPLVELYEYSNLPEQIQQGVEEPLLDFSDLDAEMRRLNITRTELKDPDFDWACKTYDYKLNGEDMLTDKTILAELPYLDLERDTDNPDILFSINKQLNDNGYEINFSAYYVKSGSEQQIWKMSIYRTNGRPSNVVGEWCALAQRAPRKLPTLAHYRYKKGYCITIVR